MSKIERRAVTSPIPTPARAVETKGAAAPAAAEGDRFIVTGAARTAERMRGLSDQIEELLAFTPRSTAQAKAWMEEGQALHADAAPRLKNGDLKSLPLKERQTFTINVRRLEHFLEKAPGIIDFIAGK